MSLSRRHHSSLRAGRVGCVPDQEVAFHWIEAGQCICSGLGMMHGIHNSRMTRMDPTAGEAEVGFREMPNSSSPRTLRVTVVVLPTFPFQLQ